MRRILLAGALLAIAFSVWAPAAGAVLTATQIRIGDHPAFVRVVVDFTGGALRRSYLEARDVTPSDGRASVRVTRAGVQTRAARKQAEGVLAGVVQLSGAVAPRMTVAEGQFKYLEYFVLHSPERLVINLWKAAPPSPAAEFRTAPQGGCLTLDRFALAPGRVTAGGSERDLFEHMFQAALRNRNGKLLRSRSVTASGGRWSTTLRYTVTQEQAGTLEAVDFSEQDGALICIVQVRVALEPAP
ncbi:MAG: Gmad2 immunoglobulin-like domain-containing protein [Gaiellaceae bacterium]